MSFGERLKHYRLLHHMSQSALGKTLNVTAQTVSKWENNLSQPDFQIIDKITKFFQVSYDQLLSEHSRLAYQGILLEVTKDLRMEKMYNFFTLFFAFLFASMLGVSLYTFQLDELPAIFSNGFLLFALLDLLVLVLISNRRDEFQSSPILLMNIFQDHLEFLQGNRFVFCKNIEGITKREYPVYENIGTLKIKVANQFIIVRNVKHLQMIYKELSTLLYTAKKGGSL
jgi:transcriptional regulator with XRE-family HTH domain